MKYLTKEQTEEAKAMCRELPLIADKLMRIGLYETALAMRNGPLQKIGYELAERACWNDDSVRHCTTPGGGQLKKESTDHHSSEEP